MKLFDLHCDTLSELYRRKESPEENSCHVSFRRAFSRFEEYGQVTAVWSRHSLDGEENFRQFDEIVGYHHITQSKSRKQRLRECADVDYVVAGIHSLKTWVSEITSVAQLAVVVIFHNPASGFGGPLKDVTTTLDARHHAERTLMRGC